MLTVYKLFGFIPILRIEYWGFEEKPHIRNTSGQYELASDTFEADDDEYYEEEKAGFGFHV